jgi:hypothetical protein
VWSSAKSAILETALPWDRLNNDRPLARHRFDFRKNRVGGFLHRRRGRGGVGLKVQTSPYPVTG